MVFISAGSTKRLEGGRLLVLSIKAGSGGRYGLATTDGSTLELQHQRGMLWRIDGNSEGQAVLCISRTNGSADGAASIEIKADGDFADPTILEINDIRLGRRISTELVGVKLFGSGEWEITNLQPQTASGDIKLVKPSVKPAEILESPVEPQTVLFAFDRSASMRWAYESDLIATVVEFLGHSTSSVLALGSETKWASYGSFAERADGLSILDVKEKSSNEVAELLRPERYSSGALIERLLIESQMGPGSNILVVTDTLPDPAQFTASDVNVLLVVLGLPHEYEEWPEELSTAVSHLEGVGVHLLALHEDETDLDRFTVWFAKALSTRATRKEGF